MFYLKTYIYMTIYMYNNKEVEKTDNLNNEIGFLKLLNELKKDNDILQKIIKDNKLKYKKIELLYKKELKEFNKKNSKTRKNNSTGFTKLKKVPPPLVKLLNIKKGELVSRTDITKKIWEYIKINNLYYEKDKRVLRVNKELINVFKIDISVNSNINPKNKDAFTFYTIQNYISQCYNEYCSK